MRTVRDLVEILRNHGFIEQTMSVDEAGTRKDSNVERCLELLSSAYGIEPEDEIATTQ